MRPTHCWSPCNAAVAILDSVSVKRIEAKFHFMSCSCVLSSPLLILFHFCPELWYHPVVTGVHTRSLSVTVTLYYAPSHCSCNMCLHWDYTALHCCQGYIVCCFNLVVGPGLTAVCQTRGCSCGSCHVLAAEPSEQLLASLQAALLSDSHSEPSGQSRLGNLLSRLYRKSSKKIELETIKKLLSWRANFPNLI